MVSFIEQTGHFKEICKSFGADLVGIANLKDYIDSKNFGDFPFAISMAVKLDDDILNEINDHPTAAYADLYRVVNCRLDEIADKVHRYIINLGYKAKIVPASKIVDEQALSGSISHKAIARLAGLGWQGKSLLIVNQDIGPRFRLVTVLTDMPLAVDRPLKNRCGGCILCTKHCPAKAIKNIKTENYYKTREEAVDLQKCYNKLLQFKAVAGINATVCGVCVKVCPYGRRKTPHL